MNHHYVPQFLLKKWHDASGKLIRWSPCVAGEMPTKYRPLQKRAVSSEGAGFLKNLYRDSESIGNYAHRLETKYFQIVDSRAALVLKEMLLTRPIVPIGAQRWHWIEFMRSLQHRSPEGVAANRKAIMAADEQFMASIRFDYPNRKGPDDPDTYEQFARQERNQNNQSRSLGEMPGVIAHRGIAEFMFGMIWQIREISNSERLILSDDPILRTNGLGISLGHLAMPISTRRVLILANGPLADAHIGGIPDLSLVRQLNTWTAESAQRFVVTRDCSHEAFIRERFGIAPKPNLMTLVAEGIEKNVQLV